MTKIINPIKGAALLASKAEASARGMSLAEHAAALGLSWTTYKSRIAAASAAQFTPLTQNRYPTWNDAPRITGDVLILGDLQIPFHHSEFVNKCIHLAQKWGITQAILAGDAIDARAFSHWPPDFAQPKASINGDAEDRLMRFANTLPAQYRAGLASEVMELTRDPDNPDDELKTCRTTLRQLATAFDKIVWFSGNHEARIVRTIQKALSLKEITKLFDVTDPKWSFSSYYFAEVESGGVKYKITHPRNSTKGSSKRLAAKFGTNIIMLHGHHFSVQSDPSGKYIAVEPGMCADPERMSLEAQRDNVADTHMVGAVIIRNGFPWLLNLWTDWETLLR